MSRTAPSLNDVHQVEMLMSQRGVSLYDLEVADHVENILDDEGAYTIDETEGFRIATARVDHHQLADVYEMVRSKQLDAVVDALAPWRRHESGER